MRRAFPLVLLAVVLAGCGGGGNASAPKQALLVTVNQDGWGEIWLMDESGGDRVRVTPPKPAGSDAAGDTNPAWSPDGTHIVYVGTGDWPDQDPSHQELYAMDGNGKHVEQLTTNAVPDWSPDWSPDGKHIVFVRATGASLEDVTSALFVMDADGSHQKVLYRDKPTADSHLLFTPAWSPDGSQIAFMKVTYSGLTAKSDLYVMKSDGSDATVLLKDAAEPAWSPDGKQIVFTSVRDHLGRTCFQECQPSEEVYVANADGSSARRLTTSKADDSAPVWSHDGKQIAFVSDRSNRNGHQNEIYVVDATGGQPKRITTNAVWDLEPDWK